MTEPEKLETVPVLDPEATDTPEAPPEPEPWTPESATEWNRYYDRYVALGVLLLAFIASANTISHAAIWPQLQAGRVMLAKGAPLTTDIFSYTEEGKPWVNIPWLFELANALLFKGASELAPATADDPGASAARAEQFGAGALVALAALIRLVTALVLLKIRRPGPGLWWTAICVLLALGAAPNPTALFSPRELGGPLGIFMLGGVATPGGVTPETWGVLFLALELWLLHRAVNLGRKGAAFALPIVFLLWANIDASFLVGLFALAASAVGRIRPQRDGEAEGIGAPAAFAVLAVSAAACLINPSFFNVYPAAFDPLLRIVWHTPDDTLTFDRLSFFSKELQQDPSSRVGIVYYLCLVALGLGSFFLNRRRFSLTRFLVYLVAAILWGLMIRFGPEFAVVLAATLSLNGQEWYQENFGAEGRIGRGWSVWSVGGRAVTILIIFACVFKALTGYSASPADAKFGFGFDPDDFAFEAAAFLKSAPLQGNILNTSSAQGDALIWRAYPERKTFLDGRSNVFTPEVRHELDEIRRALSEDDIEKWKPPLDKSKISVVMIQEPASRNTYQRLMRSLNWVPFYDDGNVVMFGRADGPPGDVAFFKANRLEPETKAYRTEQSVPPPDRPPTPVTWIDSIFQGRLMVRPQPHTEAAGRWLRGLSPDPSATTGGSIPDPARCLLAIREARAALASKPNDPRAFRLLSQAYRTLLTEETALLNGVSLTPENLAKLGDTHPRPDLLVARFRQYVAALTAAIATTPPPRTRDDRLELNALNYELFQLYASVNYLDLARDRLAAVMETSGPNDFSAEDRAKYSQILAQLNEQVKQIEDKKDELAAEQQPGPVALANFAVSRGAPGLALHELEEAERTGTYPAQVKPLLLDLYCDTGQPDKAIEILNSGVIGDPTFGAETGLSEMRHGRAFFLGGSYEYASKLWEDKSILKLRMERGMRALSATQALLKGEAPSATAAFLEIPEKIAMQASWEFEDGLCRLEGGNPKLAADHFSKALTLVPKLSVRPVIAYYLEKLGEPVPPESPVTKPAEPAKGDENGKEKEKKDAPAEPAPTQKPR